MIANATINAWRKVTGTTGAGEPVLSELVVGHKIPCELLEPSAGRRATERAVGLVVSRVVLVPAAAIASLGGGGHEPAPGDRLYVARTRTPSVQEELDLVEARELADEGGSVWELKFGKRVDSESR